MKGFREWYTIPALAIKWRSNDITEDDIEHMIETQRLKATVRDTGKIFPDTEKDKIENSRAFRLRGCTNHKSSCHVPGGISWTCTQEIIILCQEVISFEDKYFISAVEDITTVETTAAPDKLTDSPEAYATRRKEEGATASEIARELRAAGCHYSTIGRTLEPLPEVENSAYGKRGKKLAHC